MVKTVSVSVQYYRAVLYKLAGSPSFGTDLTTLFSSEVQLHHSITFYYQIVVSNTCRKYDIQISKVVPVGYNLAMANLRDTSLYGTFVKNILDCKIKT